MNTLPFELPSPDGFTEHPVWTGSGFQLGGKRVSVLEYSENFAGWSDNLTTLHEESAGNAHPIDRASRADAVRQLGICLKGNSTPTVLEVGCSSGFLLDDISKELPRATLVGADVVRDPLYKLAKELPTIPLMRFDLLQCPLPDGVFDAVVLLNVLEHIEDDVRAMRQLFRLLKPNGVAIIEVPAGQHLYDSYDKALMHFRRYAMHDLVAKLQGVGFDVIRRSHLGYFIYPAFAYIKRRNQKHEFVDTQALVSRQARDTSSSFLMKMAMSVELLAGRYVSYPIGIRCLVTASKKSHD